MAENKPATDAMGKTTSHKTAKGAHGGGTAYHQLTLGKGFLKTDPIPGHTQKKNVDTDKKK